MSRKYRECERRDSNEKLAILNQKTCVITPWRRRQPRSVSTVINFVPVTPTAAGSATGQALSRKGDGGWWRRSSRKCHFFRRQRLRLAGRGQVEEFKRTLSTRRSRGFDLPSISGSKLQPRTMRHPPRPRQLRTQQQLPNQQQIPIQQQIPNQQQLPNRQQHPNQR